MGPVEAGGEGCESKKAITLTPVCGDHSHRLHPGRTRVHEAGRTCLQQRPQVVATGTVTPMA